MSAAPHRLPLLPLVLAPVPAGLRLALAQEGIPTRGLVEEPAAGRFVLYDSLTAEPPQLSGGQQLIDVAPLRDGVGPDPFVALADRQPARQTWQVGPWRLSEEVSRFDKRAIRQRLVDRLRGAVEAAGGVWLRVAPFPHPYRGAFNLRLDHDEYDAGDFERLLSALAGHEGATSHFVCGSTHEPHPEALERLRGMDVGSHGYWHHTYHDPQENLRNVRRGIEVLRAAGIEPSGFVAPHGRFNAGLLAALESLGVTHSSEFGVAYDEWPFEPEGSSVLQLPVHPICLGLFLEAVQGPWAPPGASNESAARAAGQYLASVVRSRYQAGEPALIYGHPNGRLGRYPQVVRTVLAEAQACGSLWSTSLTDLARWWHQRTAVELVVWAEGDGLRMVPRRLPRGVRAAVEYFRDEHVAVFPLTGEEIHFSPAALAYQSRPAPGRLEPVRIDGPHGVEKPLTLRQRVKHWLDWEKVTPVEEIATGTWRGRMKQTLRRLRD